MEFNLKNIVFLLSVITTALSAGLFFAWVISVIPGTKKVSDRAYLETMQSINKEILNPTFFFIFLGAALFLLINTYLAYKIRIDEIFYFSLTAMLLYIIGTLGVTMFGNVPLNNTVEALDLSKFSADDFRLARLSYEARWNSLNLIRTIAALLAFIFILLAALRSNLYQA